MKEANDYVKKQLGRFYSNSNITLTVGETRSIQVQVMGEVMVPGTYTLSALSSAFNALYAAGGISEIGTLRDIKVFRQGRVVSTIDVYDYILNGNTKGDIRLADNDVIVVGPYECLVNIRGKVKRPMFYEMKEDESVSRILDYAGGFAGDAYTDNVRLIRKSGREYSVRDEWLLVERRRFFVCRFDYSPFFQYGRNTRSRVSSRTISDGREYQDSTSVD